MGHVGRMDVTMGGRGRVSRPRIRKERFILYIPFSLPPPFISLHRYTLSPSSALLRDQSYTRARPIK